MYMIGLYYETNLCDELL